MATMSAQEFVSKWRGVTGTERATSQSHFIDVCALVGHPAPTEQDPQGRSFAFEAGVAKSGGGQGFADVWKRGFFAWEYKGPHGNLEKAYQQLLQYHEALENPPLLIVSDMQTIVIHTKFTYTAKKEYTLTLDDLLKPEKLRILHDAFFDPPGASAAELKKRTLTNLYNARPTWLELAHKRLDDAVLDAYGWPREVSDEEILARLLRLNGERAGR